MKIKALFIHGFGGSKDSITGKVVASILKEYGIETITETFNLLNVDETLKKIDDIILNNNVHLLLGTSLGGFYTLAYDGLVDKIVINPCMKPSDEIPKLDPNISEETIYDYMNYEDYIFDSKNNINTRGVFGTKDELFGDKFLVQFKKYYGAENAFTFNGGHHGAEGAEDALRDAIDSLGIKQVDKMFDDEDDVAEPIFHVVRESKLSESFKNLFPKEQTVDAGLKQEIYDIFKEGYASIGGMAGGETIDKFYSKVDMIKINKKDGSIAALCAYRFDKGGRKLVYCTANKKHPKGKEALIQIMQDDIRRTERGFWGEVSEQPLHMYIKYANAPVINADEMKKYMKDEDFLGINTEKDLNNIDPKFRDEYKQAYVRKLGDGKYHTKVGIGQLPSEKIFENILHTN